MGKRKSVNKSVYLFAIIFIFVVIRKVFSMEISFFNNTGFNLNNNISLKEENNSISPRITFFMDFVPLVVASGGAIADQIIKGQSCKQEWVYTYYGNEKVKEKGDYKCNRTWEVWYPLSLSLLSIPSHIYVDNSSSKSVFLILAKLGIVGIGEILGAANDSYRNSVYYNSDKKWSWYDENGIYFGTSIIVLGVYIYEMIDDIRLAKKYKNNYKNNIMLNYVFIKGKNIVNFEYNF